MKQLMVLVATIILGVSISGVVLSFDSQVGNMSDCVEQGVQSIEGNMESKLSELDITVTHSSASEGV